MPSAECRSGSGGHPIVFASVFSVFTLFFYCLRFLPSEQMELSAGKEVYKVDAERPIWVDARAWELFFRGGICSSPIESNTAHLSHPIHPLCCNHFSGLLQVEKKLKIRCSSDVLKLTNMCFLFPSHLPFWGEQIIRCLLVFGSSPEALFDFNFCILKWWLLIS